MKLYKLENNILVESPVTVIIDGNGVLNPSEEQLKSIGYKELISSEITVTEWYEEIKTTYTEDIVIIYEHHSIEARPNLLELYSIVLSNERDNILECELSWAGKVVKLTPENQNDYGNLYAMLSNNKEIIPTFPVNFKNNTPHTSADFDELNDFAVQITVFVNDQLKIYRDSLLAVEGMNNDEIYQYLKSLIDIPIV